MAFKISIKEAREITNANKREYTGEGFECDGCYSATGRSNSMNEIKTSYEYDEFDYRCNKCIKDMAGFIMEGGIL